MVFSNTTPFIALASIDRLSLLPELFDQIYTSPKPLSTNVPKGAGFLCLI